MIAVELIRRSRSAAAIGPFGSRMPPEQPPSAVAPTKARASTAYRISDSSAPRQLRELRRKEWIEVARCDDHPANAVNTASDMTRGFINESSALRHWTVVTVLTSYAGPPQP